MKDNKVDKKGSELADLFQKYKIEQYFWRNYRDTPRIKSLIQIMVVFFASVAAAILFCSAVLPK